jgi:hypothetical protein
MLTVDRKPYEIKNVGSKFTEGELEKILDDVRLKMDAMGNQLASLNAIPVIDGRRSGSISIRASFVYPELSGFFVTGTQSDKQNLSGSIVLISKISYDANSIEVMGNCTTRPSRGTYIHEEIYKSQPDINVIVHTHHDEMLKNPRFPASDRYILEATPEEARGLAALYGSQNCINILKHGQYTVGRSLELVLEAVKNNIAASLAPKPLEMDIDPSAADFKSLSFDSKKFASLLNATS